MKVLAFTGHRPKDLGDYTQEDLYRELNELLPDQPARETEMTDNYPLTTCCARATDLCACNLVGEICGRCHDAGVFPLPPRLQPDEDYLIVHRCEACGYTFTTDIRDGR